jgi:hypothetical protein
MSPLPIAGQRPELGPLVVAGRWWFRHELDASQEMRPILGGQRRQQFFLQLCSACNQSQQRLLTRFREGNRCGSAVGVVRLFPDQSSIRHALDHLAQRTAVDADPGCQFRQRHRAALIQRQHRSELPRRDLVLPRQLLVKRGRTRLEQPHQKTEPMIELQTARNFRRWFSFVDGDGFR